MGHWPEAIHNHYLIASKDEVDGLWILCHACSKFKSNKSTAFTTKNGLKKNVGCISMRDPFMQHHWMDHCNQNVTHQAAVASLEDNACHGQRQTALNMYFLHVEGLPSQRMLSLTSNNGKAAAIWITSDHSLMVNMLLSEYCVRKSNEMCQGIMGWIQGKMKALLTYMANYSSLISDKTLDCRLGVLEAEIVLIASNCDDMG